jgi:hypothetical protein
VAALLARCEDASAVGRLAPAEAAS